METPRDDVAVAFEGAAQKNEEDAHAADAGIATSKQIADAKQLLKEWRREARADMLPTDTDTETLTDMVLSELCERFITEVLIVKDEGGRKVNLTDNIFEMNSAGFITYLNALSERFWEVFEYTGALLLDKNPLDEVNMYSAESSEKVDLRRDVLSGDQKKIKYLSALMVQMPANVLYSLNVLESLTVELQKLYEELLRSGFIPSKAIRMHQVPVENFWLLWRTLGYEMPTPSRIKELNKKISVKRTLQGGFIVFTYSPNPPKNKTDDVVYMECPELKVFLPRAFSLFFHVGQLVNVIWGPRKFAGAALGDDDDDEEAKGGIYDHELTKKWVNDGKCRIISTTKENGKFSVMNFFLVEGKVYVSFGSKNMHYTCLLADLERFLQTESLSEIVVSVGEDIIRTKDRLLKLMPYFLGGYCLAGELCDGLHFTPGDGTVTWFGLFHEGVAMDTLQSIEMLRAAGIQVVEAEEVFSPGDTLGKLSDVFALAKCRIDEGCVLYIENTLTKKMQLAKVKSARYKLLRALREKIKNLRPDIYDKYRDRVIDMKDYHGLNTRAAVRATMVAFAFVEYLFVENSLPAKCVDFMPIESVRGVLGKDNVGFAYWWGQFVKDTGKDMIFEPEDFEGGFDADSYWSSPVLVVFPDLPADHKTTVLFSQNIQGFGKSSLAVLLGRFVQIEQDECHGDTKTCQFKLYWHLRMGHYCFVSRCNAYLKQYEQYLRIAHNAHARVLIFSSDRTRSPLYLATCLAGVLQRSEEGDKVLVGRRELPFLEVVDFTSKNWKSMTVHLQALCIDTYKHDGRLEQGASAAIEDGKLAEFVTANQEGLMALRRPIDDIRQAIDDFVDNTPNGMNVLRSLKDTMYIGLHLTDPKVLKIVASDLQGALDHGRVYCEHLTQSFKPSTKPDLVPAVPGERYQVTVDALVVDLDTGCSAFRTTNIVNSEGVEMYVTSGKPHITAFVADGHKPVESIGFVFKSDETVTIHLLEEPITVETICRYN